MPPAKKATTPAKSTAAKKTAAVKKATPAKKSAPAKNAAAAKKVPAAKKTTTAAAPPPPPAAPAFVPPPPIASDDPLPAAQPGLAAPATGWAALATPEPQQRNVPALAPPSITREAMVTSQIPAPALMCT